MQVIRQREHPSCPVAEPWRTPTHFAPSHRIYVTNPIVHPWAQARAEQRVPQWQAANTLAFHRINGLYGTHKNEHEGEPFESIGVDLRARWVSANGFEKLIIPRHE